MRGLSTTTITSALRVVRAWNSDAFTPEFETEDVEWVYSTFDTLHNAHDPAYDLIADLLQVLFVSRSISGKPSATSLRLILSSFPVPSAQSTSRHPTRDSIQVLALRVFCHADHWFSDDELGPILAEESVWRSLARSGDPHYTILGEKLLNTPGWKSIISQDLPGWFDQDHFKMEKEQAKKYLAVLSRMGRR
jgi:hypothetical protein